MRQKRMLTLSVPMHEHTASPTARECGLTVTAIRRFLEAADADALDAAVGSWLDSRLRAAEDKGAELNGYYIYDAPGLDQAIAFAARIPAARFGATVELREMMER
jgi:hypothetical protein